MLEEFNQGSESFDEKKNRFPLFIIFATVFICSVIGWYIWAIFTHKTVIEDLSQPVVTTAKTDFQFTYKIVPNALDLVIPKLEVDTPELLERDRAAYERIKLDMKNGAIGTVDNEEDSPYALGIDIMGVLTMIENHGMHELLFQIHDELVSLVKHHNSVNQRATPVQRGVADSVDLPYATAAETNAPSTHVVLALYFSDLIKSETPKEMWTTIDTDVSDFINRGIAYGLYAESDVAISRSLYENYMKEASVNYPAIGILLDND